MAEFPALVAGFLAGVTLSYIILTLKEAIDQTVQRLRINRMMRRAERQHWEVWDAFTVKP